MRWRGRRQSTNIEDRRGTALHPGGFGPRPGGFRGPGMRLPIRAGGGGGIGLLIIIAILWLGFGINPLQLLGGGNDPAYETSQPAGPGVEATPDRTDDFVATVLAETEAVWSNLFAEAGADYQKPTLVLFDDQVSSACGFASSATGPFYCPGDSRLYIDLGFFRRLESQLGAPGDFAQAYVVAHEVGHHVQNLTGVLPEFNRARRSLSEAEANALSVRVELQADCYAGVWAHHTDQAGILEEGDIEEALNTAEQIGDDTLQRRSQGYVVPETFNHGTSEQRRTWFYRGYQSGDMAACDTFGEPI